MICVRSMLLRVKEKEGRGGSERRRKGGSSKRAVVCRSTETSPTATRTRTMVEAQTGVGWETVYNSPHTRKRDTESRHEHNATRKSTQSTDRKKLRDTTTLNITLVAAKEQRKEGLRKKNRQRERENKGRASCDQPQPHPSPNRQTVHLTIHPSRASQNTTRAYEDTHIHTAPTNKPTTIQEEPKATPTTDSL